VTPTHGQPPQEPLVNLERVEALRQISGGAAVFLRSGIVDRLMVAQSLIPRALHLLVVSGHHAATTTSPCPHGAAHVTGAAVDLTFYVDGSPDPAPWSAVPPPRWPVVETALTSVGMVNTTSWWHWSFSDRDWQIRTGADMPLYGRVD
jgi:D-alanyl-D-alanine dipeptidase